MVSHCYNRMRGVYVFMASGESVHGHAIVVKPELIHMATTYPAVHKRRFGMSDQDAQAMVRAINSVRCAIDAECGGK